MATKATKKAAKRAAPRSAGKTPADEQVAADPLAHLKGHPNHAEIVKATRRAQEEAVARRDAGQGLVEQGYTIAGAGEDEQGFYFDVKSPGADESAPTQKARVDRETGKAKVQ